MDFGIKLKKLRITKGLTQMQLAEILETSKSNISKYEAGSVEPNLDTLLKISAFFDVSIDYLLGNTDFERIMEKGQSCLRFDFNQYAQDRNLSQSDVQILKAFMRLKTETRKDIIENLRIALNDKDMSEGEELDIEDEVEAYRRELEIERSQKGKLQA